MNYTIKRSKRKTVAITVDKQGEVIVKAGYLVSKKFIAAFVAKNQEWILQKQMQMTEKQKKYHPFSEQEIKHLTQQAYQHLIPLTQHYAQVMGVQPKSVKITKAKTRWGSCSGKNAICYSYRVMLLSPECQAYIVVHELAHITEKNHGKNFYQLVETYFPQYRQAQKQIKKFPNEDIL